MLTNLITELSQAIKAQQDAENSLYTKVVLETDENLELAVTLIEDMFGKYDLKEYEQKALFRVLSLISKEKLSRVDEKRAGLDFGC